MIHLTTFYLYTLGVFFILIMIPLVVLMNFLLNHWKHDGLTGEIRKIIFWISFFHFCFMSGEVAVIMLSITRIWWNTNIVLLAFIILTGCLAIANWWAYFKIKYIQNQLEKL